MTKHEAKKLEIAAIGCGNLYVSQLAAAYANAPDFSARSRLSGRLDAVVKESPMWADLMAEVTDEHLAEFARR